jgi:hypothetical protein
MRDALEPVLALARNLSREDLPRLLGDLAEISATANARLTGSTIDARPDELLDVKGTARRMGVSKDFLYRNWRRYPFTRRQGRKLLFSSAGIDAYLRKAAR